MVREENIMKDRWIALYVENQVGVLAKVSGLFSGKSYNLQSLTQRRAEILRERGFYNQQYCGCEFSMRKGAAADSDNLSAQTKH